MAAGIERKYYVFAVRAFTDITATILVPAVVVLVLRYVVGVEGTGFYVALVVAFVVSAVVLWRKMKTYGEAFTQLADRDGSARR